MIVIFGGSGQVGKSLQRVLDVPFMAPGRTEVDLTNRWAVGDFLYQHKPSTVIMAAGKVGGILPNSLHPFDYLVDNVTMGINVVDMCIRYDVERLINISSSCIYPRNCPQPMLETDILTGPFEKTNEGYALGKVVVQKMVEYANKCGRKYTTLIPCNLYGPNDKFDMTQGHVVGSLITKFVSAKRTGQQSVILWGDGTQRRELMHADDLARAIVSVSRRATVYESYNVGVGYDITIKRLAETISEMVDYKGKIVFNNDPSLVGMEQKLLDSSRALTWSWRPQIELTDGLKATIESYMARN